MLKINFEFRKGIFFIRLIGNLNNKNYKEKENMLKDLIIENKFKYIVINTNYLKNIDLDGLNYLLEIFYITKSNESNLIICDKNNIFKRLLNKSIPSIKEEIEVL
ncbi:MAG: STAS domain-containing protein [Bacilli bacterium]|nr:STAS domain-containing protein [Bacilli bacterium]